MDTLTASEWLQRCADRLRRQWPTIPTADLEDTAKELQADRRLRQMSPEAAAVEWLRQGVLRTE